MKITRNLRAISKLTLILLLLIALIVGAVISYMFVIGYIVSLGLQLPKNPAVTIANITFSPQNATTFNVTILNPSYSPSTANITQIIAITKDGDSHTTTILYPLSYEIKPGNLENFTCSWDWSNYTGETVTVHAFVEEGSGATFQAKTPSMDLRITRANFNPAISITQFNITIQNSALSATYVNVTSIRVTLENGTVQEITEVAPTLPSTLNPNSSETFMCQWNWTDYRSKDIGITAHTLQGYRAHYPVTTPERAVLMITEAIFNVTDTTSFNITVQNSELSPTYANITRITVTLEDGTTFEIPGITPQIIDPNSSYTFKCQWDWTLYRGKSVTVTVYQWQGYLANYSQVTPPPVILTIKEVLFVNVIDTAYFNVTVENSMFSLTYDVITQVTVALENGAILKTIEVMPIVILYPNSSYTFKCSWDWTEYQGISLIITAYSIRGYTASVQERP